MKVIISILIILLISVADIFLFRIGILPGQPSVTIIPLLFILILINKKYIFAMVKANKNSIVFFGGLFVLSLLFAPLSTYQNLGMSIGLYLLTFLVYLLTFSFFITLEVKTIRFIFLSALLVLAFSMLYDLFFRASYMARGAGFAENPNSTALRINFMLVTLLYTLEKKRHKNILLIAGMILVFLTLSRGGMVMYLVILLLSVSNENNRTFIFKKIKTKFLKSVMRITFIGFLFSSLIGFLVNVVPAFQTITVSSRMNQMTGKESLISRRDEGRGGRLELSTKYFDFIIDEPLGYGTGMSSNRDFFHASTHNIYLRLALDFGVLGLSIYLFFIIRGIRLAFKYNSIYYLMFFVMIIICSLFTNTLLENRTFIIVLAALDVMIIKNNYKIV